LAVYVSPQGLRRLTPPMPAVCRKRPRFASVRSCIRFSCRGSLAAAFGCNERLLLVERERVSADTGIEELNLESQIPLAASAASREELAAVINTMAQMREVHLTKI
jgi:hypothetical protein